MPLVTLPYTFVGGTVAVADQVDADFNAVVNAINTSVRTMLGATTTFYVSPTGQDVAGAGLSVANPAATMTYVLNLLRGSYDLGMQQAVIQLANGTYTESVVNSGTVVGQQFAGSLLIQGNMASPGLVIWNGDPCFRGTNGGLTSIQGVTMQSSVSQCLVSEHHARTNFTNVSFGATPNGSHIIGARGGVVVATGNYTISGSAQTHVRALEAGEVLIDSPPGDYAGYGTVVGVPTVTLTGTPAFSVAFAFASNSAVVRIGAAFSGAAAAGPQGNLRYNAVLNIIGQGTSYLPGTANTVTLTTGAQYG